MLSKWVPWTFFKSYPHSIRKDRAGLYSIWCFDPFITRIFKQNIQNDHFDGGQLNIKMGMEITVEWLDNNLNNLSFFGNSESYFVHHAEDIPKAAQDFILNSGLDFSSRYFILSFSKDNAFRKKLVKDIDGEHFQIQNPPFWEVGKLLDFLSDYLKVRLSYDSKNFILNSIENSCSDFWMVLNILKLNYPNQAEIDLKQVRSLLVVTRLDQFALASMFSSKKRGRFFENLLLIDNSYNDFRSFFSFMQSHLIKVLDPTYVSKRPRASRYDKEIMNHASLWDKDDLYQQIRKFGEWEIMAKSKDDSLRDLLRAEYLRAIWSS